MHENANGDESIAIEICCDFLIVAIVIGDDGGLYNITIDAHKM